MTHQSDIERLALRIVDGESIAEELEDNADANSGPLRALRVIDLISTGFRRQLVDPECGAIQEGDHWGHLRIERLLGAGGMGQVFLAYDSILDTHVAVKFLGPKALQFIDSELFIAEARRLAKVRHPNVLAVLGAGVFDEKPGFWSEYLKGDILHNLLIETALDPGQILDYAIDLTNALSAVHEADMVHGDVKPLNVMIIPKRGAVLMDFGAGIDMGTHDDRPLARQVTPAIMPPEQLDGSEISKACDIYALGLVFYSLWTRRPPFIARSTQALRSLLRNSQGINLDAVKADRSWKDLIGRMLQRNPDDRPTISEVERSLLDIRSAPLRSARRRISVATVVFLLILTAVSALAFIKSRIQNTEIEAALEESQNYIALLREVVYSPSPLSNGKDTLMLDVIEEAEKRLRASTSIRESLRNETLKMIAQTYAHLDQRETALQLADSISGTLGDTNSEIELHLLAARQLQELNRLQDATLRLDLVSPMLDAPDVSATSATNYWSARATLLRESGDHPAAHDAILRALDKAPEADVASYATALIEHGHIMSLESRFADAVASHERALLLIRQSCDCEENLNTLIVESEIAVARQRHGEIEAGLTQLTDVSDRAARFLGSDHAVAVTIELNLLASLNAAAKYGVVVDRSVPLLDSIESQFGSNSGELSMLENNLANAYLYLERYPEARNLYERIISRSEAEFGDAHRFVLMAKYNLTELLYKSGNAAAAFRIAEATLPTAQQSLGQDNVITLELRDAKAWSQYLLGDKHAAIQALESLHADKVRILGDAHPLTQSTLAHIHAANADSQN